MAPPTPPEEINYAAVGAVMKVADPEAARRALEGEALDADLLAEFTRAFSLRPRHAERLAELLRGSPAVRVINGDLRAPNLVRRAAPPTQHETLSLHELHVLGPDGKPAEHQTIQLIRSTVDGLESLPLRFDTEELVVDVVRGGRVGEVYQVRMNFFYRATPPPEFRRGVLGATKDLTLWVSFHPDRLPARVWQARWDALDHAKVIDRELVELDNERSVNCRFDAVERAIVGFYWEW
jgi:hypothetical protein